MYQIRFFNRPDFLRVHFCCHYNFDRKPARSRNSYLHHLFLGFEITSGNKSHATGIKLVSLYLYKEQVLGVSRTPGILTGATKVVSAHIASRLVTANSFPFRTSNLSVFLLRVTTISTYVIMTSIAPLPVEEYISDFRQVLRALATAKLRSPRPRIRTL